MDAIDLKKRDELGKLLETMPQEMVMKLIPQFEEAQVHAAKEIGLSEQGSVRGQDSILDQDGIRALVFNMERGVYCDAIIDFLKLCPQIQPFDMILANELDDGCTRSGNRDVAREIGEALHMHYVFALEFIELTQRDAQKGYHGNAIFSRYPIKWAKTLQLPEENNWYFDRQRRIGGRCAIFAELDVDGKPLGVVSIHLENRTDGQGRLRQMEMVYQEALRLFEGIPILLGGDLNTNGFDGRSNQEIQEMAKSPDLFQQRLSRLEEYEPLLAVAGEYGFAYQGLACDGMTRRKPLPDGSVLGLHLDWFLSRGLQPEECRIASTEKEDCDFALEGSALAELPSGELSDHNAVWGRYRYGR